MHYLIIARDTANSLSLRQQTRSAHIARLTALRDEGRLLVAGPLPAVDSSAPENAGFVGSAIIAEFADLSAAKDWANQDPYLKAGVYQSVEVRPFKPVLP